NHNNGQQQLSQALDTTIHQQSKPVTDPEFFGALSDTQLVQAAATAKIIPRQVQIVMELYKLQQLQEYLHFTTNNSASHKQELEKRFRLMVKKRLNKEHREDLSRFRTKAEKQAFLEQEFQKCLAGYNEILAPKNNNQKKTS
ncbi:Histone acetyltransferase type B catalytic (Partial), partial [Seminavis robusta]